MMPQGKGNKNINIPKSSNDIELFIDIEYSSNHVLQMLKECGSIALKWVVLFDNNINFKLP